MYFNLWYTPNFFLFLIFITAKLTNMLIVGIACGTGSGKSDWNRGFGFNYKKHLSKIKP
jgi:hypothetical protein